jgi:lipopolysaccharide/colanic/teichoic acid biosynthesis glycosyltransferase
METVEALLLPAESESYSPLNLTGGNREYLSGALSKLYPQGTRLLQSWKYRWCKRYIDILGAFIFLLIAFVPGLLIAIVIAATSEGPIFYREWRVGREGRPFRIWKFRSMSSSIKAESMVHPSVDCALQWRVHKSHRDPRITAIGTFLRRWSLDEIPQIINVLRGEMSLVGPRPVVEAEIPLYADLKHFYLAASPGMSGLWQVSGRSNTTFRKRANLDASYVANWSIRRDLLILFKTVPVVFGRVGAR